MNISHITTLAQIVAFLKENQSSTFSSSVSKVELYSWLSKLLTGVKYHKLRKKNRGLVKQFIQKATGYSDRQIKRLIKKHKEEGLRWKSWQRNTFQQKYSREDIVLLHKTDEAHKLSGKATKRILQRECGIFGKDEYESLKNISVSHIYNLRKKPAYMRLGKVFNHTQHTRVAIGERIKPRPEGKPGFLRVDTVHQGDKDGKKGVYFINIVDEVLQVEFVFCVEGISDKYMRPVFEALMKLCPIKIINFHSDNGSEFINQVVADILNRMRIKQTKSRPRKHNDNALVEGKNGAIIRKHFGYAHIPATTFNAFLLNQFCINHLNLYLNFHRPCGFASEKVDGKGKVKKIYNTYMTPYERLKSTPGAKQYLKPGVTFKDLDTIAYQMSDTEFALEMNGAKARVYKQLKC